MPAEKSLLFSDVPVRKAVLTLAIPTVISQLITVVYNIADTFFIGQLNDSRCRWLRQLSPCHASYPIRKRSIWAAPLADRIAFAISIVLIIPCLVKLSRDCGK